MALKTKKATVRYEADRDRWRVDYYDLNGKRKRPTFDDEKAARIFADDIEKKMSLKQKITAAGMIIVDEDKRQRNTENGELIEIELKDAIHKYRELTQPSLTPAAYQNDKYYLEEFYGWCVEDRVQVDPRTKKPKPGTEPIIYVDELSALALSEFQSWLQSKGNSPSTINRKFNTLKPFFANCKIWGFTNLELTVGIKAKRLQRKIGRKVWTIDQIRKVLLELDVEPAEVFLFLAAVGCRPSQGFTLTWQQVDWDKKLVHVYSIKGGVRRDYDLPLSDDVVELLRQRWTLSKNKKPTDSVFLNTKGRPWTKDSFGDHIRKVTRKLKLEGLVPYGLRHTFITELLRANVSHRKAQLLAGHAKFETTTLYAESMKGDELHGEVNQLSETRKLT